MFCHWRDHDLLDNPFFVQPGLDEEVVHIHAVVVLLWLGPLHIQAAVSRAGQVGDQSPDKTKDEID